HIVLVFSLSFLYFIFNATPPTSLYTLSLHDALPICSITSTIPRPFWAWGLWPVQICKRSCRHRNFRSKDGCTRHPGSSHTSGTRSEEHTSELQSRFDLVCRLLLEKKNTK